MDRIEKTTRHRLRNNRHRVAPRENVPAKKTGRPALTIFAGRQCFAGLGPRPWRGRGSVNATAAPPRVPSNPWSLGTSHSAHWLCWSLRCPRHRTGR